MSKGILGDDLIQVVRAIDADHASVTPIRTASDRRREWDRNRKRRDAEAKRSTNSGGNDSGNPPEKSPSPSPQRDIIKPLNPTPKPIVGASASDPAQILSSVVSLDTAAEIVAHRKALKSALSLGSARRLAKALASGGDPEINAAEMMARGWKGFKFEWMESSRPRAGPRQPFEKPFPRQRHQEGFLQ